MWKRVKGNKTGVTLKVISPRSVEGKANQFIAIGHWITVEPARAQSSIGNRRKENKTGLISIQVILNNWVAGEHKTHLCVVL